MVGAHEPAVATSALSGGMLPSLLAEPCSAARLPGLSSRPTRLAPVALGMTE